VANNTDAVMIVNENQEVLGILSQRDYV